MPKTTQSEGTLFVQKGDRGKEKGTGKGNSGSGKNKGKPFDKEYWKDKECFKCHKKGHPSLHCDADEDDDDKSSASQAKSVKKLAKDFKSMKKAFTQLQKVKEADSDISDLETSDGDTHFQCVHNDFQFTQVEHEFEPQIAKLFKQAWTKKHAKLDLREIILLDSQSTMDLICNCALVNKTFREKRICI
jgi:hypothetical protein